MDKLLKYLKVNEYENIYIIRALLNDMKGFEYIVDEADDEVKGIACIWNEIGEATVRGNQDFCKRWLDKYSDEYSFYDLSDEFLSNKTLLSGIDEDRIFYYFIMNRKKINEFEEKDTISYQKIDKKKWFDLYYYFIEKYDKEFKEFYPENMEWLVVYQDSEVAANISIERVYDDLVIISNFYVTPEFRNKGIGTKLLKSILNDYKEKRIILFVDEDNEQAIRLYERLGFEISCRLGGIE